MSRRSAARTRRVEPLAAVKRGTVSGNTVLMFCLDSLLTVSLGRAKPNGRHLCGQRSCLLVLVQQEQRPALGLQKDSPDVFTENTDGHELQSTQQQNADDQ